LQGYNCQAVTSADGLIIAVSANNNPAAVITYTAMTAAAVQAAAVIANHRPTRTTPTPTPAAADTTGDVIGIVLADAGYLSEDNLTAPGPDRLIAGRQGPRGGTRRPHQPGTGTAAGHRGPHRGHGPPATHTGRDRDQPATQPHRRNPLRSRETQPRIPPIHQPRPATSRRRMELPRRRQQPLQGHHHRPPDISNRPRHRITPGAARSSTEPPEPLPSTCTNAHPASAHHQRSTRNSRPQRRPATLEHKRNSPW